MRNRDDFRKSAVALVLTAALSLAAPVPAAALSEDGSPWGGIWGWLTDLWESSVEAVATASAFNDQGAGLDPNG